MLYLNSAEIKKTINYKELVGIIEDTLKLYETGNFVQPDRITVNRNEKESYLYMPSFTEEVKGTKVITLFGDNLAKGVPTLQGVMLLNDVETGKIKCILDGASITAYRTGAVGACGIKYTTPQDVSTLGVVGTGVQAYYQSLYACEVRDIKKITVFDIFADKAEEFKQRLLEVLKDVEVNVASTTEELLKNSEVIVTTTTATKPVLPNDPELLKNKHYVAVGSYKPNMQELPQALFELLDEMFIDVEFAKEEAGDLINPIENGWIKEEGVHTLGKFLDKEIKTDKTTLYKTVGMALFDIFVADYIYKKAVEMGLGQMMEG